MPEPIDGPVRAPLGGWPNLLMRLEPIEGVDREWLVYEMACTSRRWRIGVIVKIEGADCDAFPHETVDEIARNVQRKIRQAKTVPIASPALSASTHDSGLSRPHRLVLSKPQ